MDLAQEKSLLPIEDKVYFHTVDTLNVNLLIDLVEKVPFLYNLQDSRYKNIKLKDKVWLEIANIVDAHREN